MTKTKAVAVKTTDATLRRCIGSKRYGIEPHEALVEGFPTQPSQKDGLGRMCKSHWNQYTAGLARDAKARKAEVDGTVAEPAVAVAEPIATVASEPEPTTKRTKRTKAVDPVAEGGDAG
jgi:hypothetical protein